ncbi:OsmC family protein [Mucilaginibacter sp. Bleaf8]|uniref:OsmC family protein n=1 Tax=Mucilaginibacter sp. Bleaf8 TaxID=2834430 RepID=UPI001BCF6003|nr:OsmC family protein [Mucilaginibacter sp. Bleaf8]MBS7563342.1 OsmC family protein [Mucilaginibacter sp. Bleaf8]
MNKEHQYTLTTQWTGNNGTGTSNYKSYQRSYQISIAGKPDIAGSSDPQFMGDPSRHNPEDLLVASLSACHMLWYLHLCAEAGVMVVDYVDRANGTMVEMPDGSGRFTEVTLNPMVTITDHNMADKAMALHAKANKMCFIANSVNFPVRHVAICKIAGE